jgi:hypothetical protein
VKLVKFNCYDYRSFDNFLNYLQEENIMNSHILEYIDSEKGTDVMHSVEYFIGMIVAVCAVGLICIAAL